MYLHCVLCRFEPLLGRETAFYQRYSNANNFAKLMDGLTCFHICDTKQEALETARAWDKQFAVNANLKAPT